MHCKNTAIKHTEKEKTQPRHRLGPTVSQEVHHNKRQTYNLFDTGDSSREASHRNSCGVGVRPGSAPTGREQSLMAAQLVPRNTEGLRRKAPQGWAPTYMETTAIKVLLLNEQVSDLVIIFSALFDKCVCTNVYTKHHITKLD